MNDQPETMNRSEGQSSLKPGIQWNTVTWYTWGLAAVIFLVAIPGLAFYLGTQYQALEEERKDLPPGTACTEEAKICPDGSTVARIAPSCEFAPCPTDAIAPLPPAAGSGANTRPSPGSAKPIACTLDAKICPDGSAVGRVAPDCAFAKCASLSGRPELRIAATVGPTCPVVPFPDDGSCADKPYGEQSLEIWDTKGGFIKSFKTRLDGTYETELTPGTYIIQLPKGPPRLPALAPITFTMEQGKLTELSVGLDTGIR